MLVKCPRCGGIGKIQAYAHVEEGICFLCEGIKFIEQAEAEKFIISEAKKDKNRAERNAKREEYCRQEREKQEARLKANKEKRQIKNNCKENQPEEWKYEGSAQQGIDYFFDEIDK